ncbi:MAG: alkaline phosphatase D family protein [Iamia sp.]
MEPIGRRSLIVGAAAAVGALQLRAAGLPLPSPRRQARLVDDPFALGVASGDPTSTGFVAWTRLAPDPTNGGGVGPDPVAVSWEVASDAGFGQVVQSGQVTVIAELAHSVHVDVDGLDPDGEWWVRFTADGFDSPVGRARTLPASGTAALRFGFVSCQKYASGYYTALRGLAGEGCDLWLHLGDYIYENGATGPVRSEGPDEIFTLADYRNRYGLYKSDLDLRAAHQAAPVIPVWDDHEVDNNYAGTDGVGGPAQIIARRTAGYRAWFEHLPVRLPAPTGPDLTIYRRFAWGDLATFHMLDGRQYRDPQPCADESGLVVDCPARLGEDRTMLGAEQRQWLSDGIDGSGAVWDVVGQQTVFAPLPIAGGYNVDQWDGYPQDRQRVWDILQRRPNPVVCTGDIHAAGVAQLNQTLGDAGTEQVGTELVGTSVSSSFLDDPAIIDAAQAIIEGLDYIEYANVRQRGYTVVDLTADAMRAEYKVVSDATVPDGTISSAFVYDREARMSVTPPPEETPPGGAPTVPPGTAPPATPISGQASFTG